MGNADCGMGSKNNRQSIPRHRRGEARLAPTVVATMMKKQQATP